jgi:hypothetical protein
MTKIGNAFFKGGDHRVYVDSAPFRDERGPDSRAMAGMERIVADQGD